MYASGALRKQYIFNKTITGNYNEIGCFTAGDALSDNSQINICNVSR